MLSEKSLSILAGKDFADGGSKCVIAAEDGVGQPAAERRIEDGRDNLEGIVGARQGIDVVGRLHTMGILPVRHSYPLTVRVTPPSAVPIATRRVGGNIWARMVEAVLPNLQQVAPIWEDGQGEHPFSGPFMSRWIVPVDDTNTMFIEFRYISETDGVTPAW
jgi:hypothetical protein